MLYTVVDWVTQGGNTLPGKYVDRVKSGGGFSMTNKGKLIDSHEYQFLEGWWCFQRPEERKERERDDFNTTVPVSYLTVTTQYYLPP